MIRQLVVGSVAAGSLLFSGGCLIVSGNSSSESGILVSDSTMRQIEVGTTTEDWLLATLGEPTDRQKVKGEDDVEILRYEFTRCESSGGAVFLIFAGGKDLASKTVAYFEVTDRVITRAWREGWTLNKS